MKKNVAFIASTFALASALSLSGCGGNGAGAQAAAGSQPAAASQSGKGAAGAVLSPKGKLAADDLADTVDADVEKTVTALTEECDALIAEIDSFEAYTSNIDKTQAFYDKVLAETDAIGIRMRQYSVDCASTVMAGDRSSGQMYDDLEVIYEDVYDGAGGDIYDGIYEDLFEKLYDAFYNGVVKDAYDSVGYGEWSETSSAAYEMYSDAQSDVYKSISDFQSDVYKFSSDVRSKLFNDKMEKAEKEITDFQEDIDKLKKE